MPLNSSADLLFSIGADATDAQANIQRFRALMSKDLAGMKAEFGDWAKGVFGDLGTMKGGMVAMAAASAAAVVGLGAAFSSAAEKTAKYAEEIEDGMDKTGLSAEEMSKLRYTAEQTGLGYERLVGSLVIFETKVVEAASSADYQNTSFHKLGISQAEVKAGTESLMPLLLREADAYKALGSTVQQAAISREQFGRGGADLLEFLNLGSTAIQEFGERAKQLGRVLTEQDVVAAKAFKLANQELKAEMEGMAYTVGNSWMPIMQKWAALRIALAETMKKDTGGPVAELKAWGGFFGEYAKAQERLKKALDAATAEAGTGKPKPGGKTAAEEYYGLSSILDKLTVKTAGLESEEAKVAAEAAVYRTEVAKAGTELDKLRSKHAITAASAARESGAMAQLPAAVDKWAADALKKIAGKRLKAETELLTQLAGMQEQTLSGKLDAWDRERDALIARLAEEGNLNQNTADLVAEIWLRGAEKIGREYNEAILAARRDLEQQLIGLQTQTYTRQHFLWDKETDDRRAALEKERKLDAEAARYIEDIRSAGHAKISREQNEAFRGELLSLQQHLAQMLQARMTAAERIGFLNDQQQEQFSAVREAEALSKAGSPGEREAIEQQFALNRQAALDQYGASVVALYNSQGWQGVFGNFFAQGLRENEELLREWAESADQAFLMVRVAGETLGEGSRRWFGNFAQGMGGAIAQAIVYKKSVGEAMREALAATLASIAAESFVWAIYSTALGFVRLAQHNYKAAGEAFTAAAIFGSVGAAAAVAGRAVAPAQAGKEASGGGSAGSAAGAAGGASDGAGEGRGTQVTIVVQGHVIGQSGVDELCQIINEAVVNRDVRLVATSTRGIR